MLLSLNELAVSDYNREQRSAELWIFKISFDYQKI